MPPRFTFWTIILDGQPTAFRAADREELLPTLKQLQAKNPGAVLKWFARGRVWESPEEARRARSEEESAARGAAAPERRGHTWRPGGEHRDPRDRFKKETFQARKRRDKKAADLARGPRPDQSGGPGGFRPKGPGAGGFGGDRPPRPGGFRPKGPSEGGPRGDRPGNKSWGEGDREQRPDRAPREERRPAPGTPPTEQAPKPVAPPVRVTPSAVEPAAPPRTAPPIEPGPPAPAHKSRLPRLRKP